MKEKEIRLADYVRKILGNTPGSQTESVGGGALGIPGVRVEAALGGLESAIKGRAFASGQAAALEAVVHKTLRPAVLIKDGSFGPLPDPWGHVGAFKDDLRPVIQGIGRIEVDGSSAPFGGTGFLVGKGLMLTNRHVAELFIHGTGSGNRLRYIPDRTARLENGHEYLQNPSAGLTYKVLKGLVVHPYWDAALLQVAYTGDPRYEPAPLVLQSTPPAAAQLAGRDIVVIGYPYHSEYHDAEVLLNIFNGILGVKRIQPGKLVGYEAIESYGHTVEALIHDASTLGGNSGSATIDLETQQVLSLHFAGAYLKANYSVPMWELARDPRMVDAGLNFSPAPSPKPPATPEEGGPIWLGSWADKEGAAVAADGSVPIPSPAPTAPLAPGEAALIDPGWFERYSEEDLRRMYQRDPERFRSLLAATFPPEEAQEIYDTVLFDASVEGLFDRAVDPKLPEIVLIPGILGSHLKGSAWGRSWMNALTLPFSNLLGTLGLDHNGNDPNNLNPDGYLELSYAKAARAWRKKGFMVHEFSYDWRKPLAISASRLDRFLRQRRKASPQARFALVCHSMGGLVASIYARDNADWRDFVEQSIFCGCPLGGSFAIMEILTGEYSFVRKIAKVSLNTSLKEMRTMGSTFPGAMEMLPHPALFSQPGADAELLYDRKSYADFARPGADWLRAARAIKDDLRNSPLLGRTTCFVCVDRPTAGTFITLPGGEVAHSTSMVRGDATVPAASALVNGVTAYRVTHEHSELLADPAVIASVPDLLLGKAIPLDRVTTAILTQPLTEAPPPSLEALDVKWELQAEGVRERMRKGISTAEDARWLLSTH